MRRFVLASSLLALLLLVCAVSQTRANGIDSFTFTEGATTLTWQLPSMPTPDASFSNDLFIIYNVSVNYYLSGVFQSTVLDSFIFCNATSTSCVSGTNSINFQFGDLAFILAGVGQMYTGLENAPTFTLGTYSGFDTVNLDANGNYLADSLVISPEPSALLLLLSGFLAVIVLTSFRKVFA